MILGVEVIGLEDHNMHVGGDVIGKSLDMHNINITSKQRIFQNKLTVEFDWCVWVGGGGHVTDHQFPGVEGFDSEGGAQDLMLAKLDVNIMFSCVGEKHIVVRGMGGGANMCIH